VPTPVPTPVPTACGYLQGYYSGVCQSSAGATAIAFSVYDQGGVCVAGNSNVFNPVILGVNGSAGYAANLTGIGVAINNTNLQVFGAGRFSFTGYNYAGNFWFTCSN